MNPLAKNRVAEMLEPVIGSLPPEAARQVVDLTADEAAQRRVETLAAKANEGTLTDAERAEYESIVDAADIIATLQAVARRTLRTASAA